jgi:hypothetical protein
LPTVNELASQELAKRYSLAGRTQLAPRVQTMRAAEPSMRSSLSEFMRDVVDATGLEGGYRQGLLNAAGGVETAVDFLPVVGDALAVEDASRAYGQGDMVGAGINMMGVVPVVGDVAAKGARSALRVRPPSDNITNVRNANFQYPKTIGDETVNINSITGNLRVDQQEQTRINRLADQISSPEGYISRIIVDQNNNVIEGQHRLEALRQLGAKEVPVYKIEELADTMPVRKMEEAINTVGNIHSDHVNQIMQYALDNIAEEGVQGARNFDFGNFQKYYDAALNAVEDGESAFVGDVASKAAKAGRSSLSDFVAEAFPKSYKPSIVEPYVGAGIDPRTFTAGSGSKASDPRVGDVERNLNTQIQYGDQRIQTIPEVNLEDYEGYPFMSSISDTSGAGDVIQMIDGVPVNVSRRGGQDYMFDPLSDDFVWASARNVVKGAGANPPPGSLFGRALALKERTGKDPLFIPHSMTPTGSDFSQVADVMLSYAKNNMNKTTLKKLDKDIKSLIPEWKGLGDESSSDILNRAGGEQRKKIINLLDKDYTDKGSLTAGQARLALTDQEQRIIRPGTLRNVGIVDTSRAPMVGSPHPIYDTGLYGSGLGRLSSPASVYELNPAAAYLGGITPEQIMSPPRSTGSQGGLRSLEGAPLTGIITEDVLRQMEMRRAMAK